MGPASPMGIALRDVVRSVVLWVTRGSVWLYRCTLGPVLTATFGASCRFEPSCSSYALDALRRHGPVRGGWLSIRRVSRCRPGGGHGWDPVPGSPGAPASHQRHSPCATKAA